MRVEAVAPVRHLERPNRPTDFKSVAQRLPGAIVGALAPCGEDAVHHLADLITKPMRHGQGEQIDPKADAPGRVDRLHELDPTPFYPDDVEVNGFREGQPVADPKLLKVPITDCASEDGWMYLPKIDPNDPDELMRIELCGQVCTDFQMSGKVDIQYRCPDQG